MMRIGIDVGGTNTDAVLIENQTVRHTVKTPTTEDVTSGIETALKRLLERPGTDRSAVDAVMIGTTHFTNAVVQRRGLGPIAAIRIGLPAAATLEPFVDWPPDLRALVRGRVFMVRGGHEVDGRPIVPLDTATALEAATGHTGVGHPERRHLLGVLAAQRHGRGRGGGDRARRGAGGRRHLLPRPRAHRAARPRERDAAQRGTRHPRRAHDARLRRRDREERARCAPVRHPERRHGHGRGLRTPFPGTLVRFRPHEQPSRRRHPRRRRERHGGRYRRHDLGCRLPHRRFPARGQQRHQDRRSAHPLPHAGPSLAGSWRRLARGPAGPGAGGAGERRQSALRARPRVRGRGAHRHRHRRRGRPDRSRRAPARRGSSGRISSSARSRECTACSPMQSTA